MMKLKHQVFAWLGTRVDRVVQFAGPGQEYPAWPERLVNDGQFPPQHHEYRVVTVNVAREFLARLELGRVHVQLAQAA